jgi:Fe-S-cluster containining protein
MPTLSVPDLLGSPLNRLGRDRATVSCSCRTCPNCCRVVRVPLTHRDLLRLTRHTARPVETFVEWLAPDEIDMTGEPESFIQLDLGRRLMVLRHEGGGCHLLNDEGLCSHYAARPAACAAYPFALADATDGNEPRRLFVLPDSPCGDSVTDGGPSAHAAVRCVETELVDYVNLVGAWNRRQRRRRLAGHREQAAVIYLGYLVGSLRT